MTEESTNNGDRKPPRKRTSERIGREICKVKGRITALKEEVRDHEVRCVALEKEYDTVYMEEMQKKLHNTMFKKNHMTHAQVLKSIELGVKVKDSLDAIDIDEAAKAILGLGAPDAAKDANHASSEKDSFSFSLEE